MATTRLPAVEGWFSSEPEPHLIGSRCSSCGTYFFPKATEYCRNPHCTSDDLEEVPLSRRGTLWSWTVNHYEAPKPYMAPDPFEPYGVAAVELAAERMVVLGQLAAGVDASTLKVGTEMEIVIETLFAEGDTEHLVWKWRPVG